MRDPDDKNEFVSFEKEPTLDDLKMMTAPRILVENSSFSVASSFFELLTDLRLGRASDISFYWNVSLFHYNADDKEILCKAFWENTSLKSLHIHLSGVANINAAIQILAEAMRRSETLCSVTVSIRAFRPQQSDLTSAMALKRLLNTSTSIQILCFKTMGRYSLHEEDEERDLVADYLFDGLAESSLCHFVYANQSPVSDCNRQKANEAILSNSKLRQVDAIFASGMGANLQRAMADKRRQWKQQWLGETVPKEERLIVLEEILSSYRYKDKVTALYRFLRCQPKLFLG